MTRPWNATEDLILRACCAHLSQATLAAVLGRSVSSINTHISRLGLGRDRSWAEHELAAVRANYGKVPARQIGVDLGRPLIQIHHCAKRLGLSKPAPRRTREPGFVAFLRARHAEGWSDAEIAAAWGVERHTVGDWRKRLGLPANTLSVHRRELIREKTAEQLRAAGLTNLAELRAQTFRQRALASGWPADLRPRAVQMLNALWDRGPMTRRELADVLGMPWKGSRKSLVSNDPEGSYLAHLTKRGLVVNLGRVVRGTGSGHSACLYALAFDIERGVTNGTA